MAKVRIFKDSNYKAIFINGKTLRISLDSKKPMTKLEYPEFYDVKITNKCQGGCPYCYQDSRIENNHYDILNNIQKFFGSMTPNQRPFQVAIGGGEPTLHPDFFKCLKAFHKLGIMPNYTTNGLRFDDELIENTRKYCGGVAITMHKHLKPNVYRFIDEDIRLNLHIMIDDARSIDTFVDLYNKHSEAVEYFVLLPIVNQGRATNHEINSEYLFKKLKKFKTIKDIAFGAMFHPMLKKESWMGLSLYDPEIFSSYLDMKDMVLHKSSFAL